MLPGMTPAYAYIYIYIYIYMYVYIHMCTPLHVYSHTPI